MMEAFEGQTRMSISFSGKGGIRRHRPQPNWAEQAGNAPSLLNHGWLGRIYWIAAACRPCLLPAHQVSLIGRAIGLPLRCFTSPTSPFNARAREPYRQRVLDLRNDLRILGGSDVPRALIGYVNRTKRRYPVASLSTSTPIDPSLPRARWPRLPLPKISLSLWEIILIL